MKKWWLLLLILVCSLFTACKKNTEEDVVVEEIDIPGVEVDDTECAYEYSYSEQQDGGLLFTIKGEWQNNEAWKIEYDQDVIAEVKELAQSNKEEQFEFTPKEGKSGYSEYFIELFDTDSQEKLYTFVVPIMLSQDEKISVLNIFFYAATAEEVEENVEEDIEEEMLETDVEDDISETDEEDEADSQQEFDEIIGEIALPKDSETVEVIVKEYDDRKAGEEVGEMLFTYEDEEYGCIIAPKTPLYYFQKRMDEYTAETQYVDDIEVYIYDTEKLRYYMWKNDDGVRYVLSEKMNGSGNGIKIVEMMIKNN